MFSISSAYLLLNKYLVSSQGLTLTQQSSGQSRQWGYPKTRFQDTFILREYILFIKIIIHNISISMFNMIKTKFENRDMNKCKIINIFFDSRKEKKGIATIRERF